MRMTKGFDEDAKPFGYKPRLRPGPKRSLNVSINAEILAAAKAQGINLSQTLEETLAKLTQEAREARWREENRESVESYNRLIERAGVIGEEFQDWDEPSD
jgi:antitoxin CcdA